VSGSGDLRGVRVFDESELHADLYVRAGRESDCVSGLRFVRRVYCRYGVQVMKIGSAVILGLLFVLAMKFFVGSMVEQDDEMLARAGVVLPVVPR